MTAQVVSGSTDRKLAFVAVDSTDLKTRETGLSSFTVYRSREGGTATAWTTPTVAEVDGTNMPGVYVLTIDEDTTLTSGKDFEQMCLHITQASMAPVTLTYQLVRPKITEGEVIAVSSGVLGTGVIAAATLASDTITAAKIATDAIGAAEISAAAGAKIADIVMRRTTANIEASSDGDTLGARSLYGAAASIVHKRSISGSTLTVTKADDTTSLTTMALTSTPGADPITAIDPA